MRTIAQPTVSVNSASDALLAANAQLQRLRAHAHVSAIPTGRHVRVRANVEGVGEEEAVVGAGRGSFLVVPDVVPAIDEQSSVEEQSSALSADACLRMYPDLLLGMLREEQVAIGRIWLLCRHLDHDGRGWLEVRFIREQLTRKASPLRVVGQRRLRQILRAGAGMFWERDHLGRLWLYGTVRVAKALGVERLTNRPIALPIRDIVASLAHTRAHCYAAFHSGRASVDESDQLANPISRTTLTQLAGVTGRTQRRYDDLVGVEAHACIAIGAPYEPAQHADATWQHGNATFPLTDHLGKLGTAGTTYTAWQLPNQYRGCHQPLPSGRQRKLNKQLRLLASSADDLVTPRARGNASGTRHDLVHSTKFARVFFNDGRQAANQTDVSGYLQDITSSGVWRSLT